MAVLSRRRGADATTEPAGEYPGRSLAKGPIGLLGLAGIAAGIIGLIAGNHSFALHHVPHGAVHAGRLVGVGINGWTDLLFVAAGLALLLGSPVHWLAKGHAFLVACVLGAAAIIAAVRGDGIFGIFAANHVTEIIWGAAAVALLLLSMLPRVGRRAAPVEPAYPRERVRVAEPVTVSRVGAAVAERPAVTVPVAGRPLADDGLAARPVDDGTMADGVDEAPVTSTAPALDGGRMSIRRDVAESSSARTDGRRRL